MSRLERLVNLTAALIDTARPLTREELRERVGGYSDDPAAFRRTFERDKELLRLMGMPVTATSLELGRAETVHGYRIHRADYELADPGLSSDELAALRLATSAVQVEGADHATTTALRKLAGAPGSAPIGPGGGQAVTSGSAAVPGGEHAATIFGALAARQRVEFDYRDVRRVVDPWRLSYRNGQWYLSGYDHSRAGERLFRLDRLGGVVSAVGDPAAFDRPASAHSAPAPPWQIGDDDPVTVTVLVDAGHAAWAADRLGDGVLAERRPDGSTVFAVEVTNLTALMSFVLGLLDHAEILGPPTARDAMVAWLEAVA